MGRPKAFGLWTLVAGCMPDMCVRQSIREWPRYRDFWEPPSPAKKDRLRIQAGNVFPKTWHLRCGPATHWLSLSSLPRHAGISPAIPLGASWERAGALSSSSWHLHCT